MKRTPRWSGLLLALLFTAAAAAVGCVDADNNFDFEGEDFYYGCNVTSDCADPRGESVEFVCCYDQLDPAESNVCEGRCVKQSVCPDDALPTAVPNPCDRISSSEE